MLLNKSVLCLLVITSVVSAYKTYCKCQCGQDYAIYTLEHNQRCRDCNADFCLSKNSALCGRETGEDAKNDIITSCFRKSNSRGFHFNIKELFSISLLTILYRKGIYSWYASYLWIHDSYSNSAIIRGCQKAPLNAYCWGTRVKIDKENARVGALL